MPAAALRKKYLAIIPDLLILTKCPAAVYAKIIFLEHIINGRIFDLPER